ncbi:MAG: hypothetical protein WC325_11350 [Candidatus Bathyarchaeia archaeon]
MLATYGKLHTTNLVARCGRCGSYRKETEIKPGKRGDYRCVYCGQQVKMKPQPSRMNLNMKRRLQRLNKAV